MRQENTELTTYGKRGMIFEGLPGIGKSDMLRAYLNAKEIPFCNITLANLNQAESLIKQAFHQSHIVVIDEINTVHLENMLNAYLTGTDNDNKPPQKESFMVIGTQNPGHFMHRQQGSTAWHNRFETICVDDYSTTDLFEIIKPMLLKHCSVSAQQTLDFELLDENLDNIVQQYQQARQYGKQQQLHPLPCPRDVFHYVGSNAAALLSQAQPSSIPGPQSNVSLFVAPPFSSEESTTTVQSISRHPLN